MDEYSKRLVALKDARNAGDEQKVEKLLNEARFYNRLAAGLALCFIGFFILLYPPLYTMHGRGFIWQAALVAFSVLLISVIYFSKAGGSAALGQISRAINSALNDDPFGENRSSELRTKPMIFLFLGVLGAWMTAWSTDTVSGYYGILVIEAIVFGIWYATWSEEESQEQAAPVPIQPASSVTPSSTVLPPQPNDEEIMRDAMKVFRGGKDD